MAILTKAAWRTTTNSLLGADRRLQDLGSIYRGIAGLVIPSRRLPRSASLPGTVALTGRFWQGAEMRRTPVLHSGSSAVPGCKTISGYITFGGALHPPGDWGAATQINRLAAGALPALQPTS